MSVVSSCGLAHVRWRASDVGNQLNVFFPRPVPPRRRPQTAPGVLGFDANTHTCVYDSSGGASFSCSDATYPSSYGGGFAKLCPCGTLNPPVSPYITSPSVMWQLYSNVPEPAPGVLGGPIIVPTSVTCDFYIAYGACSNLIMASDPGINTGLPGIKCALRKKWRKPSLPPRRLQCDFTAARVARCCCCLTPEIRRSIPRPASHPRSPDGTTPPYTITFTFATTVQIASFKLYACAWTNPTASCVQAPRYISLSVGSAYESYEATQTPIPQGESFTFTPGAGGTVYTFTIDGNWESYQAIIHGIAFFGACGAGDGWRCEKVVVSVVKVSRKNQLSSPTGCLESAPKTQGSRRPLRRRRLPRSAVTRSARPPPCPGPTWARCRRGCRCPSRAA